MDAGRHGFACEAHDITDQSFLGWVHGKGCFDCMARDELQWWTASLGMHLCTVSTCPVAPPPVQTCTFDWPNVHTTHCLHIKHRSARRPCSRCMHANAVQQAACCTAAAQSSSGADQQHALPLCCVKRAQAWAAVAASWPSSKHACTEGRDQHAALAESGWDDGALHILDGVWVAGQLSQLSVLLQGLEHEGAVLHAHHLQGGHACSHRLQNLHR